MSGGLDAYSKKLVRRAEGIWQNMGLDLMRQESSTTNGGNTLLQFYFHRISSAQASILVASMSEAFRKANTYWKEDSNGIVINTEIPPLH